MKIKMDYKILSGDKKASLFVGRWQPFHSAHKALVEKVLKKGKPVVIAIRDTQIDKNNPFSISERWNMIQKALREYNELIKIVVVPDIDEICYGRNVGYRIREIKLDKKLEIISGTKIRQNDIYRYPIYWITGQSGSGKTTLAKTLQKEIGGVVLDGDEMRKSISTGLGFGREDRHEHNLRVARLALVLSIQSPVIVSLITPFEKTRKEIDKIVRPTWIYIKRKIPFSPDRPYEEPRKYNIKVNSDRENTGQQVERILNFIKKRGKFT